MNDKRILKPYFEQNAYDKVFGAENDEDAKIKHMKYI